MGPRYERLSGVLICAAALVLLSLITGHMQADLREDHRLIVPPPLSRLDTRFLNVATLGYRRLYDDFMDFWIVQEIGEARGQTVDPEQLARVVRDVTRHGPKDEPLYMLACFVLGLDMHRPDLCEGITQDGLQALPESWRIPMTAGFMNAFREGDKARAAAYYALAGSRPGAPAYLADFAKKLQSQSGLDAADLETNMQHLLGGSTTSHLGEVLEKSRQSHAPVGP